MPEFLRWLSLIWACASLGTHAISVPEPAPLSGPNIFTPISGAPSFPRRDSHPQPGVGVVPSPGRPKQTNKFYSNWYLGSQKSTVFTFPYSMAFTGDGMSISHTERNQLVWGPGSPPQYFINPIFIRSIILSASSLTQGARLNVSNLQHASVQVSLAPLHTVAPSIVFPVVQGQAFITALYIGAQPLIKSEVSFTKLSFLGVTGGSTYKYEVNLADGTRWLIYLSPDVSQPASAPSLSLKSRNLILGPASYVGSIQVAKSPTTGAPGTSTAFDVPYDNSAGCFPISMDVSASVVGGLGEYRFSWQSGGAQNRPLLMYLLPHHVESIHPTSRTKLQPLMLNTPTKGTATAFLGNFVSFREPNLPINVEFDAWPPTGKPYLVTRTVRDVVQKASEFELAQDLPSLMRDPYSMYWQGKGLARYAMSTYVAFSYAKNLTLAFAGLQKLKKAMAMFVSNTQAMPLYYDGYWGGVVTSASYASNNAGLDYGASYYNDHHFHYSYFVYAAAIIAHLDPKWLNEGSSNNHNNKAWVNSLVRDYASPVNDNLFPFSRSFDWWHGHSWAAGLFESADGKNEESTSEDGLSLYALKLWGVATGDAAMQARGDLQLAILQRSLASYVLLVAGNTNQPAAFVPNKQAGILFENKLDHTTYFGARPEYIAGIHQLPIVPASAYLRSARFVLQEWNTYFSGGRVDGAVDPAWRHLLYANYALVNPVVSWRYFTDRNFDPRLLDSGASWSWYLAFAAAMGGAGDS